MSAAVVVRCDGFACPASFAATARDFPAARLEATDRGWQTRGVAAPAGVPVADLCPRCVLADALAPAAPVPSAADAWRCFTCGAPEDDHHARHPFRRPTLGRRPRATPAAEETR